MSDDKDIKISNLATKHTIDILKRHGNTVSKDQYRELQKIVGHFTRSVSMPEVRARRAFALPCGGGKTTAVRGYLRALSELDQTTKVVICAEKIEALCELMRDLVNEDGVSRDKISLLHTYKHDPDFDIENPKDDTASEPSDSDKIESLRQFVLMSHSKLHNGYNKMPYDLVIYDESLVLGLGSTFEYRDLFGAIGKFTHTVEGSPEKATQDQKSLATWLVEVKSVLSDAEDNDVITFPELPIEIKKARHADKPIHGNDNLLRNFMGRVYDQSGIRLVRELAQGGAVVSVKQTIPNEMDNICILDASYPIRRLMTHDDTISVVPMQSDIKDHSEVTIHHAKARGGRGPIMKGLGAGADIKLFDEVAYLTARLLKGGRNVLLFTFKNNGISKPIATLRELIRFYLDGTDPDMLSNGSKLNFLTWGYETALNRYSDCDAVVFGGVLTLPTAAVAASVFAHARDINRDLPMDELNEVVQSEKVHSLYQALSRGSCRIMNNGKANAMDAYVFSHDHIALTKALKVAMPGVKLSRFTPKFLKNKETKTDKCMAAFADFIDNFVGDKLSTRKLNQSYTECSGDIKTVALNRLMEDGLDFEWKRQGKSLVKLS